MIQSLVRLQQSGRVWPNAVIAAPESRCCDWVFPRVAAPLTQGSPKLPYSDRNKADTH